jgi:hypothetical protein
LLDEETKVEGRKYKEEMVDAAQIGTHAVQETYNLKKFDIDIKTDEGYG